MGREPMQELRGLGVADGIAMGTAVCVETRIDILRIPLPEGEIAREFERFDQALEQVEEEVRRTHAKAVDSLGSDLAGIFEAQGLLLTDRTFLRMIRDRIRNQKVNAEWAVFETSTELEERLAQVEPEHIRERREDLRDVTRGLLRSLQGISHHELSEVQGDVVIVAHDLTPSDAVRFGREHVVAFAIESGGKTSHTSIIARSLNIPSVTGLTNVTRYVTTDDPLIVDGEEGRVLLHPTAAAIASFEKRKRHFADQERALLATRDLPAITLDGCELSLMANVDLPEEMEDAVRFGATGVGLYRSEFLYIERNPVLPTEEDHLATYRHLIEQAAPHPTIIRTYDLGGRKLAQKLMETEEENPVLGLRGVRLTLARTEFFKTQLRALLRAATYGDLRILVPLITAMEEIQEFKKLLAEVSSELSAEGMDFREDVPVGIMIEVPAAALIADLLAEEADFFSIGTNDLIQYSLAVDRNNEHVTNLYQPLHPAMLRLLSSVIRAADEARIPLSVCGEMAGDSLHAIALLGLGVRRFSMSPRRVPAIKNAFRRLDTTGLRQLLEHCLSLRTSSEVEEHLRSHLAEHSDEFPVRREAMAP